MQGILGVFLALFCLCYGTPVQSALQTKHAQAQTVQALKAFDKGQETKAHSIIAPLKDPLATKLYNWMKYRKKDGLKGASIAQFGRMSQFVRKNPSWPSISSMKKQIEAEMPQDFPPESVVAWFSDYKPQTARGTDLYLQALLQTGRKAKMQKFLQEWWADTPLSRSDQKFLFTKYSGYLTIAAHKKRLDTLLFAKQYTNARAIAGVLGRGYPELTEARIALAAKKKNVNSLISKVPRHLTSDPGLQYERLKWRRKNDMNMRAIEILQAPKNTTQIHNRKNWWRERHIIIRRLLEKKQYDTAYLLASKHIQKEGLSFAQAEWIAGWLSLNFLNNPRRAFGHFETLYAGVKSPISKARAAYWGGLAARAVGRPDIAKPWLQAASQFQITFYGQLAAKELAMGGALPHRKPPILTAQDKDKFNARQLVQAAKLFKKAGMNKTAKSFLFAYAKTLNTPEEYRFAAEMAAELGFYRNGIKIAKDATKQGMFLTAQSYPLITNRLHNVRVDWSLIHGLIRQESAFDFDAQSHVGARGLMQLMPATAKEVARKNKIQHRTAWLNSRPDHNIRLGSLYLAQMLKRFNGYYPMAIAAYNAGPGRVDKWIKTYGDPRTGEVDLVDWIEMLPIYETRNYVQRVLEATYVYRLRLKGREPNLKHGKIHTNM